MHVVFIKDLFYVDTLSMVMISLISWISITIYFFSKRYMAGDTHYNAFLRNFLILFLSLMIGAIADNLVLFLCMLFVSNCALVRLIIHKSAWVQARASGMVAAKTFLLSFICITLAFLVLYLGTSETSIQAIIHSVEHIGYLVLVLILLLLGAMMQSALWPFHRWLISSSNSPMPVSAIMHAGMVNGGVFLLIRFAPLYLYVPYILHIMFIGGFVTALLGKVWQLMQHDVKRMLACSTISHMGFLFAECGLGLFSVAVIHLFLHALFKTYLLLSSGGAAQEKRVNLALLFMLFLGRKNYIVKLPSWVLYLYVKLLNMSQPHSTTITAYRKHYTYL